MRRTAQALALPLLLAALLAAPVQAAPNPLDHSGQGVCGGTAPYKVYCEALPTTVWTSRYRLVFDQLCTATGCASTYVGSISVGLSSATSYTQFDCTFSCEVVWTSGTLYVGQDVALTAWVGPFDGCYEFTVKVPPHEPSVSVCPPVAHPAAGVWSAGIEFY